MKVLATIRPKEGVDFERDLSPLVPGEVAEAWRLYKEGVVRELYATADGPGAVLVMECEGPRRRAESSGVCRRSPPGSPGPRWSPSPPTPTSRCSSGRGGEAPAGEPEARRQSAAKHQTTKPSSTGTHAVGFQVRS